MNIKQTILKAYDNHTEALFSEVIEGDKHKAFIFGSLQRKPAEVTMIIQVNNGEHDYNVASVMFNDKAGKKSPKSRRDDIRELAKKILNTEEFLKAETSKKIKNVQASKIIDLLGLFGARSNLKDLSIKSFNIELKKLTTSDEEYENALKVVDQDLLVDDDIQRIQKPIAQMDRIIQMKIHPDTLNSIGIISGYDWHNLHFYGGDEKKHILRRQAAVEYPILAEYISRNASLARTVIDTQMDDNKNGEKRQSLGQALAIIFDHSPKDLKKFKSIKFPLNGLSEKDVIEACRLLPNDWIPKDIENWNSFTTLIRTVGIPLGGVLKNISVNPEEFNAYEFLFKDCKGKWADFHKRCVLSFSETRIPQGLKEETGRKIKEIRSNLLASGEEGFLKKLDKMWGKAKLDFVTEAQEKETYSWLEDIYTVDMSDDPLLHASASVIEMASFIAEEVCIPTAAIPLITNEDLSLKDFSYTDRIKEEALRAALILTICPNPENTSTAKNIPNIFKTTRQWLNRITLIQNNVFASDLIDTQKPKLEDLPAGHWPKLFHGEFDIDGEYYFTCLSNEDELKYEGRGTGHGKSGPDRANPRKNEDGSLGLSFCIGSYGHYCLNGKKQIISLRKKTPDGSFPYERVATLELIMPSNMADKKYETDFSIPELVEGQFYALSNTRVDDDTLAKKQMLMQALKSGDLRINTVQNSLYHQSLLNEQEGRIDPVKTICMYDWQNTKNISNAMNAVGGYIHDHIVKKDGVRNPLSLFKHETSMEFLKAYIDTSNSHTILKRELGM